MLRHNLTPISPSPDETPNNRVPLAEESTNPTDTVERLDIQQSLDVLEELILESPRVPFSRRTLVDEDRLLEQLDRIRLNLPSAFRDAIKIVQQQNGILAEAERYAQEIIKAADQEAARRLDDVGIVQQAEAQAQKVRQQLQQECDVLRSQTLSEIEQWQNASQQHWEQAKQQTEAECQAFKQEADAYAAQVLSRVEQQLSEMLGVVYNGRQALQLNGAMGSASEGQVANTTQGSPALPQSNQSQTHKARPGRPRRQAG